MDTELMQAADVVNAVGITAIFFYFLSPTIVVLLTFYIYRRHKLRKELRNKEKEQGKKEVKSGEINEDALKNIPDEPEDFTKYSSLALEFGEDGKVKSNSTTESK